MVIPEGVGPIQPSNESPNPAPSKIEGFSGEVPNANPAQEHTASEQQPAVNVAPLPVEKASQPSLSILQPEENDIVGLVPGGLYGYMRKMRERKEEDEEEERRKLASRVQESDNQLPKAA